VNTSAAAPPGDLAEHAGKNVGDVALVLDVVAAQQDFADLLVGQRIHLLQPDHQHALHAPVCQRGECAAEILARNAAQRE
jgi:hypothetical protein